MNRTARFDFNPLARPAPITCCSVARHHYPTPDERKESATAGRGKVATEPAKRGRPKKVVSEAKPRKPAGDPNFGAKRQCQIGAHWPTVIIELMAEGMTKREIRDAIGVSKYSLNDWLAERQVPGPDAGDALAALYSKRIGGQLPKGKE